MMVDSKWCNMMVIIILLVIIIVNKSNGEWLIEWWVQY